MMWRRHKAVRRGSCRTPSRTPLRKWRPPCRCDSCSVQEDLSKLKALQVSSTLLQPPHWSLRCWFPHPTLINHNIALQDLVGRQLERGLGPLRQLPAAVAAEVVDEMRAAALQRGTALNPEVTGSNIGGGIALPQGALMLGDGAGQAWQARSRPPAA